MEHLRYTVLFQEEPEGGFTVTVPALPGRLAEATGIRYRGIMKAYTFRVIIESEKPKGYHGFVPILKGVHTFGDTIEEVKQNLHEAIRCHVQGMIKDREAIPQEGEAFETIQSFSERELSVA